MQKKKHYNLIGDATYFESGCEHISEDIPIDTTAFWGSLHNASLFRVYPYRRNTSNLYRYGEEKGDKNPRREVFKGNNYQQALIQDLNGFVMDV